MSVANDCGWPSCLGSRLQRKSRINSKGENKVEVVDNARDKWDDRDRQDDNPKYLPHFASSQWDVNEPVGRSPQVEPWKLISNYQVKVKTT